MLDIKPSCIEKLSLKKLMVSKGKLQECHIHSFLCFMKTFSEIKQLKHVI